MLLHPMQQPCEHRLPAVHSVDQESFYITNHFLPFNHPRDGTERKFNYGLTPTTACKVEPYLYPYSTIAPHDLHQSLPSTRGNRRNAPPSPSSSHSSLSFPDSGSDAESKSIVGKGAERRRANLNKVSAKEQRAQAQARFTAKNYEARRAQQRECMRRLRERRKELPPEQQAEFRSQALKHGQTWRERHREKLVEKRDKERQKAYIDRHNLERSPPEKAIQ